MVISALAKGCTGRWSPLTRQRSPIPALHWTFSKEGLNQKYACEKAHIDQILCCLKLRIKFLMKNSVAINATFKIT